MTIANAFARALIAGGVVLTLLTGALGGLWFALIGWFLLNAAAGEGMLAAGAAAGPHVAEVTVRDLVCVPAATTVEQFLDEIVAEHRHLAYPVVEGSSPVGLVSFRDAPRIRPDERAVRSVAQIMTPLERVLVLDGTRPLAEAVGELMRAPLRRALVVDRSDWIGLLSPTDALRAIELLNRR